MWPYPCHRHGHIFEEGNARCVECKARHQWDDVADIALTGQRRFADKRRAELPDRYKLPSGLVLDLA